MFSCLSTGKRYPLTGDAATYGVSHKNGLELAFSEINAAGGLRGQEIELITHDDAGDPKQAAAGAQKFADQERVLAIADRAYVLETGTIVLRGKAEELSANQQSRTAYLGK